MENNRHALLLGLAAVLFWSTAATAFKLALVDLSVLQLLAVAITTSAFALAVAAAVQQRLGEVLGLLRREPLYFSALAGLNPLLYYCILLAAYDRLPAQQAQTINYTWAVTLAVLSIPALGHRLAARDWFAVLLGYFGVVIIATEGAPLSLEFTSPAGVALALASTVVWAVFWLASTRSRHDPVVALTAGFLCATPPAILLALGLGGGVPAVGTGLVSAIYVGLFEMGFTWLLWSAALRSADNVSRVGNLIFLSPLLSLGLIAVVLDEAIHPATLIGFALILPGLVWQQRGAGRKG